MSPTVTAAQIADEMGISKRTAQLIADVEGWAYSEEADRGGTRRLYIVAQLPAVLRAKLKWKGSDADATPESRAATQAGAAAASRLALRFSLEARAAANVG